MRKIVGSLSLFFLVATSGCAGRQIYHLAGCQERLAMPEKKLECRACVERPRPHKYLPDNPDGARCVLQ
jgi:hypothetical protein